MIPYLQVLYPQLELVGIHLVRGASMEDFGKTMGVPGFVSPLKRAYNSMILGAQNVPKVGGSSPPIHKLNGRDATFFH